MTRFISTFSTAILTAGAISGGLGPLGGNEARGQMMISPPVFPTSRSAPVRSYTSYYAVPQQTIVEGRLVAPYSIATPTTYSYAPSYGTYPVTPGSAMGPYGSTPVMTQSVTAPTYVQPGTIYGYVPQAAWTGPVAPYGVYPGGTVSGYRYLDNFGPGRGLRGVTSWIRALR